MLDKDVGRERPAWGRLLRGCLILGLVLVVGAAALVGVGSYAARRAYPKAESPFEVATCAIMGIWLRGVEPTLANPPSWNRGIDDLQRAYSDVRES